MSILRDLIGMTKMVLGETPVPVRTRFIPKRQRQKRHFKAGRRRAGRHCCMPPRLYGVRIGTTWEPFDPSRLMTQVVHMVQEMRL